MALVSAARLSLEPVRPEDVAPLLQIRSTPEVSAWWGFPDPSAADRGVGDADADGQLSIRYEHAVVGLIQYDEENDPGYRHASMDIYLAPEVHGRGLGSEALHALAAFLFEQRGHHRLTIDPARDNHAAIACYERIGFQPVGILRQYERDPAGGGWRDGLLMDLLADELTDPSS